MYAIECYYDSDSGIQLFCCDCNYGLSLLGDESIAMIMTSPPYFAGKPYDEHSIYKGDILSEWARYHTWLITFFKSCHRVLVPGGKLVINIDDKHTSLKNVGRNLCLPTHSMIISGLIPQYDYKEMILWRKIRGKHASGGSRRMLGSYGNLHSPGEIPIVQEVEFILIFRKRGRRHPSRQVRVASALTPEEFRTYGMQIWEIPAERDRSHPAPFPIEIPSRVIKLFSFVGDIILDPFMGWGTTAAASYRLRRKCIGFDNEPKYCEMARQRLLGDKPKKSHR